MRKLTFLFFLWASVASGDGRLRDFTTCDMIEQNIVPKQPWRGKHGFSQIIVYHAIHDFRESGMVCLGWAYSETVEDVHYGNETYPYVVTFQNGAIVMARSDYTSVTLDDVEQQNRRLYGFYGMPILNPVEFKRPVVKEENFVLPPGEQDEEDIPNPPNIIQGVLFVKRAKP